MSDFPSRRPSLPVIGTANIEVLGASLAIEGSGGLQTGSAWAANRAVYLPMRLRAPFFARRLGIATGGGTISGNFDAGIYSIDGTRLASLGSTALTNTAHAVQSAALATPLWLPPGAYYLAFAASAATFFCCTSPSPSATIGQMLGLAVQTAAFPLPAAATFATWDGGLLPYFAMTNRTVI